MDKYKIENGTVLLDEAGDWLSRQDVLNLLQDIREAEIDADKIHINSALDIINFFIDRLE